MHIIQDAQIPVLFYCSSYHNILNVMLHQVVLGGDQHRSAKGIQICVVQLVRHAINCVRCVQVDVSDRK